MFVILKKVLKYCVKKWQQFSEATIKMFPFSFYSFYTVLTTTTKYINISEFEVTNKIISSILMKMGLKGENNRLWL